MNGPQHYVEAERVTALAESVDWQDGDPARPSRAEYAQTCLAAAQVHATLALTAATAEPIANKWDGATCPGALELAQAWTEAIS